jgi:hypothetical protein
MSRARRGVRRFSRRFSGIAYSVFVLLAVALPAMALPATATPAEAQARQSTAAQTTPEQATGEQAAGEQTARGRTSESTTRVVADLRARLDSLAPLLSEAEERLRLREIRDQRAARDAAAAIATVDTVHVGLVTIIAPIDQIGLAVDLFTEVWTEYYSNIEASNLLEQTVYTFQWSDDQVPIHVASGGHHLTFDRWMRRSRVATGIREALAKTLELDLKSANSRVSYWVFGSPFREHDYRDTYRFIATTRARVTRNCLAGDAGACGSAMGLDAPLPPFRTGRSRDQSEEEWGELEEQYEARQIESLTTWYTPEERRAMVAGNHMLTDLRSRPTGRDGQWRVGWGECVEARVSEACDALLVQFYANAPLPGQIRETLVAYALERGGPGAWSRLLDNPEASATEALEYASALPIDELLTGWRTLIISNRPDTYSAIVPRGALAVLWVLFFSFLAMRSTRWRLG